MSIEAMKQALEALENASPDQYPEGARVFYDAKDALRQAIEQYEKQEPVAWGVHDQLALNKMLSENPPQREWVGLTEEEIAEGIKQSWITEQAFQSAAWWAEERLKEKNK